MPEPLTTNGRRIWTLVLHHRWAAVLAGATGVVFGIGVGLAVAHGHWGALLLMALVAGLLLALVRAVAPADDRMFLVRTVLFALGLRLATASVLYFGSLALGRSGWITGDDAAYANVSWGVIQWLRGQPEPPFVPPYWHGEAYLLGSFVYLEMVLFSIFGPFLLNTAIVNAGLAIAALILVYDIVRQLYGRRPARLTIVLTSIFPSMILWSSLNLKDALSWLLIASTLWLLLRFQHRHHLKLLLAVFIVLIPMETIRRYVYIGLAGIFPIAVAIAPRLSGHRRLAVTAASLALAFVLASFGSGAGQGTYGIPTGFATFEAIRQGMGQGARTSFAEPRAIPVREGSTFNVVDTSRPTEPPTGRIVVVAPGSRVVLESIRDVPAGAVVVRAGDVVVVGQPGTTPNPVRSDLALRSVELADTAEFVLTSSTPEALALTRTLSYLPKGIAYALFAPFPWALERSIDFLTIPEMLMWYVTLAAMPWALIRFRPTMAYAAPVVLYVGGMLMVFTLTEGNFGTLYRHRAMVIPFAIGLASPGLLAVGERLAGLPARFGRR